MSFRLRPEHRADFAERTARLEAAVAHAVALSAAALGVALRDARAACPDLCRWAPGAPVYDATFAHLHLPVLLERLGVAAPVIEPVGPAWMWESYLEKREALAGMSTGDVVHEVRARVGHVALHQVASPLDVPRPGSLLMHVLLPELLGRLAPAR
jgi:hypothetical protein